MKMSAKYLTLLRILFFASGLFFTGMTGSCLAEEQNDVDIASPIEINASIMEVDLANNFLIVAEKKINLLSRIENGNKKWQTVFLDTNGREISINKLQIKDRVIVTGKVIIPGTEAKTEVIEADTVTLIGEKKEKEKNKQETNIPSSPTPVHLKDGVWKN
jgi:hypothetical protein